MRPLLRSGLRSTVGLAIGLAWTVLCRGQAVTIESADVAAKRAAEAARLLRPPDESEHDRYSPGVDWRDIPAWRQTSFYGVRSQGTFFVFVIDCSGSMADAGRWLRVQDELRRTLAAMEFPQRYYVLFYNTKPWSMPGGVPQSADRRAVSRTLAWISRIAPEGGTDPRGAMAEALALRPHAVYLLSDGEFPEGSNEWITRANPSRVPVHCIDVSGGANGGSLKRIAHASGGQYVARP